MPEGKVLREVLHVKSHPGEPIRRWFTGGGFDLLVWVDDGDGRPVGFQLSYGMAGAEKTLTWREGRGYSHQSLDQGESEPLEYKMAPILLPDGAFPRDRVLEQFTEAARGIDSAVAVFVADKIRQFSA